MSDSFQVVLVSPEIPGNTGSIGRTCLALEVRLILIKPIAFDLSEKAVRRAGLDYWKHVNLSIYENFDEFLDTENPKVEDLYLFSRFAKKSYYQADFKQNSYLIFGSETKGLDRTLCQMYEERNFVIPTKSPIIRSLNLANAATAVALEAQRQILKL